MTPPPRVLVRGCQPASTSLWDGLTLEKFQAGQLEPERLEQMNPV